MSELLKILSGSTNATEGSCMHMASSVICINFQALSRLLWREHARRYFASTVLRVAHVALLKRPGHERPD